MTTLLSDLKGAQISILVALFVASRPLSNKELSQETGYNDNETVAQALTKLSRRGLIVCLGNPNNRNEWALTANSQQFFLPQQSVQLASAEKPQSVLRESERLIESSMTLSDSSPTASAEKPQSPLAVSELPRQTNDHLAWAKKCALTAGQNHRDKLLTALIAGGIWPNLRAETLQRLLRHEKTRQVNYLADLLGHIAYSRSSDCPYTKPGAYLRDVLTRCEPCPPDYMPPSELDFEQLLLWALQDRRAPEVPPQSPLVEVEMVEPEPETPVAPDPILDTPMYQLSPVTPCALTPRQLWEQALEQLRLEMSPTTFEARLRDTTPINFVTGVLTIRVPNAYARDWLEHRLTPAIQRVVTALSQTTLEVQFRQEVSDASA